MRGSLTTFVEDSGLPYSGGSRGALDRETAGRVRESERNQCSLTIICEPVHRVTPRRSSSTVEVLFEDTFFFAS